MTWTLDANDDWESPVTFPTITKYGDPEKNYDISWDEEGQKWIATDEEDPINNFNWDVATLSWVAA